MDIYLASDGSLIRLEASLAEYDSVEHLLEEVSAHSGVVTQNVLMFLEDGRELRADILEEAWQRGGEGSGSNGARTVMYLFDRETFWAEAEDSAAKYTEEIQLPPQLPLSAIHDINLIQQPFILASDHVQHLQSLYLAQSQALSIAYSNLFYHLSPFLQEFETFAPKAEKELDLEDELIRGSRGDMAMLSKVMIHEQLRKKGEKDKDRDKRSMADYVNKGRMEQVRETCRVTHEGNVSRYNELVSAVEELSGLSEVERRNAEERSAAVGEEFQEGLSRFELAMGQVDALAAGGVDHAVQDLVELDKGMREDLIALTNIKNEYTLDLHIHLRQIANLQIQVVNLAPNVHQLEKDLSGSSSSKAAFPHLYRLRNLPFAYAATVVEVVRRKEFGQYLSDWTTRLRDVLGRFTAAENARRAKIMDEVITHMPYSAGVLEDPTRLGVEITAATGLEALKGVTIGRNDVQDLLDWVDSLRNDHDILKAVEAGDPSPIGFLDEHLGELIAGMEGVTGELDNMVEKSVLLKADTKASQTLSAHLRAAEEAKASHESHVAELTRAHQREMGDLQDRHEERTRMLQKRQGELQEELVRLRTDLDEESIARQALSTQLGETQREQEERQQLHDDQSELITGMQAELAQEKDRATDLGVRLQEALLDVDGLRNAEQTLLGQVSGMQDERSKSMQQLADAQRTSAGLESQVAGLRAELEAMSGQLAQARAERDTALRDQSAEAERMMRDHIAEADGDRAVLEHQNLTLQKELELAKVETQKRVSEVENREVRTANNLKAELSFTKAQLRTAQQKETVLADELAMSKDDLEQVSKRLGRQEEVAKEAVGLVGSYWETCSRLLGTINASATISGSTAGMAGMGSVHGLQALGAAGNGDGERRSSGLGAVTADKDKGEMKDSAVLARSLSTAQEFDLTAFSDAVTKTITLVKKWGKSCKTYRDLSRNRLSFRDFGRGDLALFLPTRNAAVRAWACFNMSAPHNFLKADSDLLEQISQRDWLIARIVKTEEAVASGGDNLDTNPFGLADGLRYWVHTVEGYNPTAVRPPRRTASTSYYGRSGDDSANRSEPIVQASASGTRSDQAQMTKSPEVVQDETPFPAPSTTAKSPPSPVVERQVSPPPIENDDSSQSGPTPALSQSPPDDHTLDRPDADKEHTTKLSPVVEALSLSASGPKVPSTTPVTSRPTAPPSPDIVVSRPTSRAHHRPPSRISSPPSRDHPPPFFAPSTFGRPASVASTASYTGNAPFATGKGAPAMAVTTSEHPVPGAAGTSGATGVGEGPEGTIRDLNPFMDTTRTRRKSSAQSLITDELFRPPGSGRGARGSFGEATPSPGSSGFQSLGGGATIPMKPQGSGTSGTSLVSQHTPSPGTSPGTGASRLMRGFSLRKRTASGVGETGAGRGGEMSGGVAGSAGPGVAHAGNAGAAPTAPVGPAGGAGSASSKPSAMDILRRFEGGAS